MLILKNKSDWKRNFYTKTEDGKRTIALDNDTVKILREWKKGNLKQVWEKKMTLFLVMMDYLC